jgi:O-antigen/teichoic acid export membrane protein
MLSAQPGERAVEHEPGGQDDRDGVRVSGRIRQVAQRAGWGVADQALSSLTNFAVGVFVARELGPTEFGAFSLAFATYLLALNASRGLATDPLAVRFSDASAESWREAAAAAAGTATLIGAIIGAGCVLAAVVFDNVVGVAFLSLGLMLPGLLLQDSWRYIFFAARRGRDAFLNDLVWAGVLGPFMAAVMLSGRIYVQWFVLAWGGAAMVAGLFGAAQAGTIPRLSLVGRWHRSHRDLGIRYLSENITFSVAVQVRLYGLGAIAGLAAVGALRAAELLLGPVNLIMMGIGSLMAIPEGARLLSHGLGRLRRFVVGLAILLAAVAMLWGLVVAVLPDELGQRLLGATWQPAASLVLPITLMVALQGVWSCAWTGLRAMGAARRSLRAQLLGSSAFLVGALAGAAIDGAEGAAWGSAAGNLVACCIWWWQFRLATREFEAARPPSEAGATMLSQGL